MTAQPASPPPTAARVWTALHEFVTGQDRRRALHAALGIGQTKVELLIQLADGPMTLREVAAAIDIDPPAATVGVDKLAARGLVQRTPHPDDNRRKLVHLTEAGRDAARRGQAILNEPPAELASLDPADLARLEEILGRLRTGGGQLAGPATRASHQGRLPEPVSRARHQGRLP